VTVARLYPNIATRSGHRRLQRKEEKIGKILAEVINGFMRAEV
jgi:hypothetical protein